MEPRIQYAKTEDGVSIAFWGLEQGTPIVRMLTTPCSHIELERRFSAPARGMPMFSTLGIPA